MFALDEKPSVIVVLQQSLDILRLSKPLSMIFFYLEVAVGTLYIKSFSRSSLCYRALYVELQIPL